MKIMGLKQELNIQQFYVCNIALTIWERNAMVKADVTKYSNYKVFYV